MSKIVYLKINHYRGINEFEHFFGENNFVVLIGRGDSGKTTIMNAISAVLSPYWNYSFSDTDFYNCDVSTPIIIEASLIDVPKELLTEDKYGLHYSLLKGSEIVNNVADAEADQNKMILTIQLVVDNSLEPKWYVVSGRTDQEAKEISSSDRAKFNMFFVSDFVDRHFTYTKGSPLYSLFRESLEDKDIVSKRLLDMSRAAYEELKRKDSFSDLKSILEPVKLTATALGLDAKDLNVLLEYYQSSFKDGDVSLHSTNIPFHLQGKGSKRLLSIAIQMQLAKQGGIILIDELEQGLEPDRITNLTQFLKSTEKGQVFVTTHSSYVLTESNYSNIYLMSKNAKGLFPFDASFQPLLRGQSDVFFARKVICCEGRTEQGIIRGLDIYIKNNFKKSFSSLGIAIADCGGGNKHCTQAMQLKIKGFDVIIFGDRDVDSMETNYQKAQEEYIQTVYCDKGRSIEQQLFNDLPWNCIDRLINLAIENKGVHILSEIGIHTIDELHSLSIEKQQLVRATAGEHSKNKNNEWYKTIQAGEQIATLWFDNIESLERDSTLRKEFNTLMSWIMN